MFFICIFPCKWHIQTFGLRVSLAKIKERHSRYSRLNFFNFQGSAGFLLDKICSKGGWDISPFLVKHLFTSIIAWEMLQSCGIVFPPGLKHVQSCGEVCDVCQALTCSASLASCSDLIGQPWPFPRYTVVWAPPPSVGLDVIQQADTNKHFHQC